jgi:hypothetical protein
MNSKGLVLCLAGCGQSFGRGDFYSTTWMSESSADERSHSDGRVVGERHVRSVNNRWYASKQNDDQSLCLMWREKARAL